MVKKARTADFVPEKFVSSDYGSFKAHRLNRELSEKHVEYFVEILGSEGYREDSADDSVSYRVTVWKSPSDGVYYITDGQHRFEACKRLGIPVPVITRKNEPSADEYVASNGKSRSIRDDALVYCKAGVPSYVKLWKLVEQYPMIGLKQLMECSEDRKHPYGAVKSPLRSDFHICTNESYIEKKLDYIVKALGIINGALPKGVNVHKAAAYPALSDCYESIEVSNVRLMTALESAAKADEKKPLTYFRECRHKKDVLLMLEDIYNNRKLSRSLKLDNVRSVGFLAAVMNVHNGM